MAVSIQSVVAISIAIATNTNGIASFAKLMFITPEKMDGAMAMASRIQSYMTLDSVAADWGTGSDVHKAAAAYMGQQATNFMVISANTDTTAASLTSATMQLDEVQAVTSGGFSINIDGEMKNLTTLDFSAVSDFAGVAEVLQTALPEATVVAKGSQIKITSKTIGGVSAVSFPSADIGGAITALQLSEEAGAMQEIAMKEETPSKALMAARNIDQSGYGVLAHKRWRDTEDAMELASTVQGLELVLFNETNDQLTLVKGAKTSIAARLKEKSVSRAITMYSSKPAEYPGAALAGRAFIVNFEGTNTTITLFLKSLKDISVEDLTLTQKEAMESHNANAVINIGGNYVFSDGRMADGTWFDVIHGTDWVKNRMAVDVFHAMKNAKKIPYTDPGTTTVYQAMEYSLRQAVTNGLCAPGYDDETGEYYPLGYKIWAAPVETVGGAKRSTRKYDGLTFKMLGSGALQGVTITGDFQE